MNYEEAVSEVTAAGKPFSLVDAEIRGQIYRVFENTPPSLASLFLAAQSRGEETFLVYQNERWSFQRVTSEISQIAHSLVHSLGITKGDRVAIAMRNLPEWIVVFAAAISVGAIAVPLNGWWKEAELQYALEDCGASVVFADGERIKRISGPAKDLGIRVVCVSFDDAEGDGLTPYRSLLSKGDLPDTHILPEDDATILYTSGTTGKPKGAVSSHRALLSAVMAFGARNEVNALISPPSQPSKYPTAFILTVPLFHVTGCVAVMLSAFASGSKLVLMYRWDPEIALQIIESERITHFVGVPTMSWDLMESPSFLKSDTSSLMFMGGGGSPVPPKLINRIGGAPGYAQPSFGYGMTETNSYGPQISGRDSLEHPTSAGKTLPIMRVRILDAFGKEAGVDEMGEVCFFGTNLFRGYWNKPRETNAVLDGGWLRTGDLGHIDAQGYLYVDDRIKDMVIRGGENVYCVEVEAAIYEHPGVYEAAVFGVAHERLGEEVAAAILAKEGATLTKEELTTFLRHRLASYKVPTQIYLLEEPLPRGATGKIQKRELKERIASM